VFSATDLAYTIPGDNFYTDQFEQLIFLCEGPASAAGIAGRRLSSTSRSL